MLYRKFVKWDVCPVEQCYENPAVSAMLAYDDGDPKPMRELHIATTEPYVRIAGWCFDLRPYLRRYWVKTKLYGIQEFYASNRMDIRNEIGTNSVIEIYEVTSNFKKS